MARDPDKQSGPRCVEVPFLVALGNGEGMVALGNGEARMVALGNGEARMAVSRTYLQRHGRLLTEGGDDASDH